MVNIRDVYQSTVDVSARTAVERSRNAVAVAVAVPVIFIFLPRPRLWFQAQRELA
jgi:hypothetical protein